MITSFKTEIPNWLFDDNVYASTALDVMREEDEQKRTETMLWFEEAYKAETADWMKHENLMHYKAAAIACMNMGARKVSKPFPGWHTHLFQKVEEPWWDWMKRELTEA